MVMYKYVLVMKCAFLLQTALVVKGICIFCASMK
jgi:hypothetical protein